MICEICGRAIESGVKVRVEGSVVTTCSGCTGMGEVVDPVSVKKEEEKKMEAPPVSASKKVPKKPVFDVEKDEQYQLKEDFGDVIRRAREKKGWKQEELGKMVNEPSSLIHRVELERIQPNQKLARKLEGKLKVKLLKPKEELDAEVSVSGEKKDLTLGDLVVVKKRPKK
ncbi:multiprotein bridging factor aMBF1 [Candidatus Altiarchaeota archaeon]